MQLRYPTDLTGEAYVNARGWEDASLRRCPNHPRGGCSLARHGTYGRKRPRGCRVARWYCPQSHMTFSLLPDCLAARLPGTLREAEEAVAAAEAAPSLAAAANAVRADAVHLPGAMRWLRRRVRYVHRVLHIVRGMRPDLLLGCAAGVIGARARLQTDIALVVLRGELAGQLPRLPMPLGFCRHGPGGHGGAWHVQHKKGPDPPGPAS